MSLIKHKKIRTTLAKAKELSRFMESLITKSKKAFIEKDNNPQFGLHLRRTANKFLKDKGSVKMLFDEIAPKVADRPGGFTRVLKLGRRYGDAAELAIIELVDYNIEQSNLKPTDKKTKSSKSAKTKGKKKSSSSESIKEDSKQQIN
ncbi:MAG: 50S ribosomal protein L17, partial [Ignavibacteria bacterium]